MSRGSSAAAALLLVAACAGLPFPVAGPPPAPEPTASPPPPRVDLLEIHIHEMVNRHRRERGLTALAWDERLAGLARDHSRAMANGDRPFGHDGFDDRAQAAAGLIAVASVAENVAYDNRAGPDLARLVVDGWIASSGHRENIEDDFDVTGVGAAVAPDGMRFFTQIFVRAVH